MSGREQAGDEWPTLLSPLSIENGEECPTRVEFCVTPDIRVLYRWNKAPNTFAFIINIYSALSEIASFVGSNERIDQVSE